MLSSRRWIVPSALSAWLFVAISVLLAGCGGDERPVTADTSKFKPAGGDNARPAEVAQAPDADLQDEAAPRRKVAVKAPMNAAQEEPAGDSIPESPFNKREPPAESAAENSAQEKYPLPKGDAQSLVQYFHEMGQRQPRGNTREEMIEDLVDIQESRLAAAKKALDGEIDKADRKELAEEARNIYLLYMQLGRPEATEQMQAFVNELSKSSQPETQEIGRHQAFQLRIMELIRAEPEDATEVLAEIKQFVEGEKQSADAYETVEQVCGALQQVAVLKTGLMQALMYLGETYKDNPDEKLAAKAKGHLDMARAMEIDLSSKFEAVIEKQPEADEQLLAAFDELLTKGNRSATLYQQVKQVAYMLEAQLDRHDLAQQVLGQAAVAYEGTDLAEETATAAANAAKRIGLIGKPLGVEGVLPDGTPFDWKPYEGKVVLVDFWATWCGPCIEEFPNIARNYRRYKEKGFEVVGISLDNELEAIDLFFSRQKLPWTIIVSQELFDKKQIDTQELNSHPLAPQCGVEGIPFVVLIGKDGNVDSIHVRGEKLGRRLEELLGEPAAAEGSPAKSKTKGEPPAEKAKPDSKAADTPASPDDARDEAEDKAASCGSQPATEEAAPAEPAVEEESTINPYSARPGLSTADLVKYIDKMLDKPRSIQGRPGFAEALCEACDRVLAADPPAKEADVLLAVETKFETLHKAACSGDAKADEQLASFCDQLKDDTRPKVASRVVFHTLEHKVLEGDKLPPEQIEPLLKQLEDYFAQEKLTARHLRMASSTVALINRLDDGDLREKHFAAFGSAFAKSSDKELARYGKKLAQKPAAMESDLIGKELQLAGTTAAGEDFDWKKYRGKVVLVDFWATWCGPCVREMPHVRELYERLHDQGLEVVGISLDKDAEALSEFLEENQLPWETLAGDDTQELAEKYSIRGIPTMMAVDKDGKILGVAHQVAALRPMLEKALGR